MKPSHSNPLLTGLDKQKQRAVSEPSSTLAWRTVLFGRGHRQHDEGLRAVITASSLVMTADETYAFTATTSQHKYHYPLPKLLLLGILAGAYIGLGYSLCCLVGGLLSPEFRRDQPGVFNLIFGIYGFPMGLTLCVVAGGDLFTSNCMYATVGWWEGHFGLLGWLRMLVVSYFSNLLGALLLVGLLLGGDVFYDARGDFLKELAHKKVSYAWGAVLLRGVLGNWLVCLAVWQGNMARDFAGKAIGVWLPDAAFVSMGLEHCIANLFLVPMAMALGAPITAAEFIRRNLIPATLGNLLGGSILVASFYACSLGTPGNALQDAWEDGWARLGPTWKPCRAGAATIAAHTLPRSHSFAHVNSKLPAATDGTANTAVAAAAAADGNGGRDGVLSTQVHSSPPGGEATIQMPVLQLSATSFGAGGSPRTEGVVVGGALAGPSPRRRTASGLAAAP